MMLIDLLALLALALLLAKVLGGLGEKIGIPSVLCELALGIMLANSGFPEITKLADSEVVHSFSEMGVLFLLFLVGLETDVSAIRKVGVDALAVAVAGVIAPALLAFFLVPLVVSLSFEHSLFIAAALTATSVGITARVLRDCDKLSSVSGRIILGAAVIDDVLGIIVLAVVTALVTVGTLSAATFAFLFIKLILFGLAAWALRKFAVARFLKLMKGLEVDGTLTVLLLALCWLFAWGAEKAGLAAIIGAFTLGVVLDDVQFNHFKEKKAYPLEHFLKPLADVFVPIFFIFLGMGVKLEALRDPSALRVGGMLLICAVAGKLVCGFFIRKSSIRKGADRWLVGFGMLPRGEVGLIFAAVGQKLDVLNSVDYAAILLMVSVTTLLAPPLLTWRSRKI